MKILLNYIGQLRLYSLADFVLLLIAIGSNKYECWGAIVLHIAFLAYLESRHVHPYRARVPKNLSYLLAILGLFIFRKVEGLLYLIASYLYTKKIKNLGYEEKF